MVVIICFMGKDDNSMRIVLIADMTGAAVKLQDLKDIFTALGRDIGVEIRVQSEEIFTAMHRI